MRTLLTNRFRALPAVVGSLILAVFPTIASADTSVPSYATKTGDSIVGTISKFDGAYTMYVRDKNGYLDNVTLHRGTIINPTGIQLQAGFSVTVIGRPDGKTFEADEIDTPYHYTAYEIPIYPYYPYPYAYGYPLYPRPFFGFGYGFRGYHGRW